MNVLFLVSSVCSLPNATVAMSFDDATLTEDVGGLQSIITSYDLGARVGGRYANALVLSGTIVDLGDDPNLRFTSSFSVCLW
jgi:hypothetical protein